MHPALGPDLLLAVGGDLVNKVESEPRLSPFATQQDQVLEHILVRPHVLSHHFDNDKYQSLQTLLGSSIASQSVVCV